MSIVATILQLHYIMSLEFGTYFVRCVLIWLSYNASQVLGKNDELLSASELTHCGLVTPYGNIYLHHHSLR